jgi:hypothetical protein
LKDEEEEGLLPSFERERRGFNNLKMIFEKILGS